MNLKKADEQGTSIDVANGREPTGINSLGLDLLTEEFDAMERRMQTPEVREAVVAAFWATSEELSRAAVAAVNREGR